MTRDQQFGNSDDLFIDHCSLVTEKGNAQALDANGNAYSTAINFTGADNAGLIGQYLSGSVFGNGSGSPTADGSEYAWNILYQGDTFNPVAANYNTPNGIFNPGQDSMLAPNPGMEMAGLSAYSQPQGFWGFYAQHQQAIDTTAGITLGLAAGLATGGLADVALGAAFGADLGFWGGLASAAVSNAAAGFAAGTVQGLASGESMGQSLEQGGIGAAFGGGLGAAGVFAPYAGQALARAGAFTGDYMTDFIRAWRLYPEGGAMYTPSLGGAAQRTLDRMIWSASAARQAPLMQLAKLLEGQDLSAFSFGGPGQEMHGEFLKALLDATGTTRSDWFMTTDSGLTGIDATYLPGPAGESYPGFTYAELKPLTLSGVRTFLNQLDAWGKPLGGTQLWFYDRTGAIWPTKINF